MAPRVDIDTDLKTPSGLIVPLAALSWSFSRSGGAGGQHVNKTSSRATLSVNTADVRGPNELRARVVKELGPTVVVISQESRSQWQNRHVCRTRLIDLLERAATPPSPARRKTKPHKGAVERRLAGKRLTSAKKAARRGEGW